MNGEGEVRREEFGGWEGGEDVDLGVGGYRKGREEAGEGEFAAVVTFRRVRGSGGIHFARDIVVTVSDLTFARDFGVDL